MVFLSSQNTQITFDHVLFESEVFYASQLIVSSLNAIFTHPLTLISAPIGYGQVAAMRCFLECTNANILWYRTQKQTQEDLWEKICSDIRNLSPQLSEELMSMKQNGELQPLEVALAVESSLEIITPLVIVLEGVHSVNGKGFDLINEVVKLRIRNLHIIVLAEKFIPIDSEMLLRGLINHITPVALALNRQDIMRIMKTTQISLKDKEIDFIMKYSDGWLAAIRYLIMCHRSQPSLSLLRPDDYDEPFLKAFKQEIVSTMPSLVISVLSYLADFDSFSIQEVEFFLAFEASNEDALCIIQQAMTDYFHFISFSPIDRCYRLHPVFRRVIQRILLPSLTTTRIAEIYNRLGNWYEQKSQFDSALRCYIQSGDDFACLRILCVIKRFQDLSVTSAIILKLFTTYREAILVHDKQLSSLPPTHEVIIPLIRYAALLGDQTLYDEIHSWISSFENNLIPSEIRHLYEWIRGFPPSLLHGKLLTIDNPNDLVMLSNCFDISYGATSLLFALPESVYDSDKREALWKDLAGEEIRSGNLLAGASTLLFAEKKFMAGEFIEAEIYLHAAIRSSRLAGNPGVWITACCTLVRTLCVQGNMQGAIKLLHDVRQELNLEGPSRLDATIDLCEFSLYVLRGQSAPEGLFDQEEDQNRLYTPALRELGCLKQLMLLNEGRFVEYISHYLEEQQDIVHYSPLRNLIRSIGLSKAREKVGQTQEAAESLLEALKIAHEETFFTPLIPFRSWMRKLPWKREEMLLLETIRKLDTICAGISFGDQVMEETENDLNTALNLLTRREAEVAACLNEGITNREIAQRLCISENTVKSTLKKIYAKLGISSRYEFLSTYFSRST